MSTKGLVKGLQQRPAAQRLGAGTMQVSDSRTSSLEAPGPDGMAGPTTSERGEAVRLEEAINMVRAST